MDSGYNMGNNATDAREETLSMHVKKYTSPAFPHPHLCSALQEG